MKYKEFDEEKNKMEELIKRVRCVGNIFEGTLT